MVTVSAGAGRPLVSIQPVRLKSAIFQATQICAPTGRSQALIAESAAGGERDRGEGAAAKRGQRGAARRRLCAGCDARPPCDRKRFPEISLKIHYKKAELRPCGRCTNRRTVAGPLGRCAGNRTKRVIRNRKSALTDRESFRIYLTDSHENTADCKSVTS